MQFVAARMSATSVGMSSMAVVSSVMDVMSAVVAVMSDSSRGWIERPAAEELLRALRGRRRDGRELEFHTRDAAAQIAGLAEVALDVDEAAVEQSDGRLHSAVIGGLAQHLDGHREALDLRVEEARHLHCLSSLAP